jgi:hypothetical protein
MVIAGEVPALRREGVPAELVALRDGLLARDRADRIQSADDALERLHAWSGYRNTAARLARLVRHEAGVEGPRSGLSVAVSTDELALRDMEASELVTRAFATDSAARSSATTPHVSSESESTPTRHRTGRLGVALGLGLASVGATLALALTMSPSHGAGMEPDQAGGAAPAVVAARPAADEAAPEPGEAAPEPGEVAPEPELEPAVAELESAPAEPPRSAARKQVKQAPAKVEFAAHEFFFVWVKVGGREHALEPVAKLSLSPGSHKVYLRESADKPWRKAGRIVVASGHQYRVVLRKPGSVALERLD